MTVRKGRCLCGARAYEIEGDIGGVWMCHCSLCRKATGAGGIATLIVPRAQFRWTRGEDHGVTFALRPTFTITRCKTCGSPLPAEMDEAHIYVTAGTLDDPLDAGVVTRLFCASRADWDRDEEGVRYCDERPA